MLVVVAVVLVRFVMSTRPDLSGDEARKLLEEGALLVDVRTVGEFEGGHIEGAHHLPLASLSERVGELGGDKERPIILYCRSGARSGQAVRWLRGQGYQKVYNLGAIGNW